MTPETQALIRRLAAVNIGIYSITRGAVERAIRAHLRALGKVSLPLRWAQVPAQGPLSGRVLVPNQPLILARHASRMAAMRAACADPRPPWNANLDPSWAEARLEADAAARIGIWAVVRAVVLRDRWVGARAKDAALDAAWTATALNLGGGEWTEAWLPLVNAYEAGLWLYWLLEDEVLLVPRPAVTIFNGRIHRADGPAVWWPDGARYYFWQGRQVPEAVIMHPDEITTRRLITERNAEVRRAMIERVGYDNLLAMVGHPRPAHQDTAGELYRIRFVGDEPLTFVRVTDPSTGKVYCLRVPPETPTAQAAVAWTFGMDGSAWEPTAET